MTRTCGGVPALSVSAARCSTPNRCCSSTTTRPRSKNLTCSSSSACVPITMPDSPMASRDSGSVRWALVIEPVSSSTPAPPIIPPSASSPSMAVIERWCCWASTSVGARSAAWPPESTTRSIARSATRVLPEPTSPWSRRFIGCGWARSCSIWAPTSRCPWVSSNGSRWSNAASRSPSPPSRGRAPMARSARRRRPSTSWVTRASSNRYRCWARRIWPQESGAWIQSSACRASSRSSVWRISSGSSSGSSSTTVRAKLIARCRSQESTPLVSG